MAYTMKPTPQVPVQAALLRAIEKLVGMFGRGDFGMLTWPKVACVWNARDMLVHAFNTVSDGDRFVVVNGVVFSFNGESISLNFEPHCPVSAFTRDVLARVV